MFKRSPGPTNTIKQGKVKADQVFKPDVALVVGVV